MFWGAPPVNDCQRAPANSRGLLQDTKTLLGFLVHTVRVIRRRQRETTAIGGGKCLNPKIDRQRVTSNNRKESVPPTYVPKTKQKYQSRVQQGCDNFRVTTATGVKMGSASLLRYSQGAVETAPKNNGGWKQCLEFPAQAMHLTKLVVGARVLSVPEMSACMTGAKGFNLDGIDQKDNPDPHSCSTVLLPTRSQSGRQRTSREVAGNFLRRSLVSHRLLPPVLA